MAVAEASKAIASTSFLFTKFSMLSKSSGVSQFEIFAEIGAAGMRVREKSIDCAAEEDFPFLNEIASIDDRKNFPGIMVCDEDADIFLFQQADEVFDVSDSQWVDICKRFIEEEEGGLGDESAGDLKASPFSTRKGGGLFIGEMF